MTEKTEIVSVHRLRRVARMTERDIQACLDAGSPPEGLEWARGVKVVRAGFFQHAVVATAHRGH